MKVRYSSEIHIKHGKIRRSLAIGIERASTEELSVINRMKSVMNAWLRHKLTEEQEGIMVVKTKYLETSSGLTIEFKVQK